MSGSQQTRLVEGPVPDECTTKLCHGDPEWAVAMRDGVSRHRGTEHELSPPVGAVCPFVCDKCRRERYAGIDDHRWVQVAEVATDGGRVPDHRFEIAEERPGISYGPSRDDEPSAWTLSVYTRDGERLDLHLGVSAMYDLWAEVHDVPWPYPDDDRSDLQQKVVERVERMDEDQLHHVLGVLHAVEHYGGQR